MPDKVSCVHCDRSYEVDFSKGTSIRCFCGKLIPFHGLKRSTQHNQQQQQTKLIDCLDCGTSISPSAFFCTKCGRPSSLTAERAKTQGCAMMLLIYVLTGLVFNESVKWIIQGVINSR